MVNVVEDSEYDNSSVVLQVFDNMDLNYADYSMTELVESNSKFWRYSGSFTTPPCTEGVTWTVFKDLLTVTQS